MGGIVWLASYPKSGNTWLRCFLHSLAQGGKPADINQLNKVTVGDSGARWYEPLLRGSLLQASNDQIASVRPQANAAIAALANQLVGVKTHNALVSHLGTPMINTAVTAGAIYVVRNPLDIAVSLASFMDKSIDAAVEELTREGAVMPTNEKFAYQYFGSWREHVWSWTKKPAKQLLVLRYEDMISDPMHSFGRVAAFLRLPVTKKQVEDSIKASSFAKLQKQERTHGFSERPAYSKSFFRTGTAGQWRKELTKAQFDTIRQACAKEMIKFGYL
jgi:hypothetical protein